MIDRVHESSCIGKSENDYFTTQLATFFKRDTVSFQIFQDPKVYSQIKDPTTVSRTNGMHHKPRSLEYYVCHKGVKVMSNISVNCSMGYQS